MTNRLPQVKAVELIRALKRLGFVVRRQAGGHAILRHPTTKCMTVIPMHAKDIDRRLLFGILKQAGISQDRLLENL